MIRLSFEEGANMEVQIIKGDGISADHMPLPNGLTAFYWEDQGCWAISTDFGAVRFPGYRNTKMIVFAEKWGPKAVSVCQGYKITAQVWWASAQTVLF